MAGQLTILACLIPCHVKLCRSRQDSNLQSSDSLIRSQTRCPLRHRTSDIPCGRSACPTSLSKSYSTPPPSPTSMHYYSGRGRGRPANHPRPLNTSSHNTAARRHPHPSYTQHTTTALGYIKLPMYQLFLWCLYLMVLRGATSFALLVPFQGPKKSQFSGPTPSNAPRNDVAPLKTITYRAIKTTGTLIVNRET